MAIRIEINDEFYDREDAADALERIADWLRSGYTSGTEPAWMSTGIEETDDEEER